MQAFRDLVEGTLANELMAAYLSDQLEGTAGINVPGGFSQATSSVSELAAVLQKHAPSFFRDQDRQFFQVSKLRAALPVAMPKMAFPYRGLQSVAVWWADVTLQRASAICCQVGRRALHRQVLNPAGCIWLVLTCACACVASPPQAASKLTAAEGAGSAAERDALVAEALQGLLAVPQCVNLKEFVPRLRFLRQYEVCDECSLLRA